MNRAQHFVAHPREAVPATVINRQMRLPNGDLLVEFDDMSCMLQRTTLEGLHRHVLDPTRRGRGEELFRPTRRDAVGLTIILLVVLFLALCIYVALGDARANRATHDAAPTLTRPIA